MNNYNIINKININTKNADATFKSFLIVSYIDEESENLKNVEIIINHFYKKIKEKDIKRLFQLSLTCNLDFLKVIFKYYNDKKYYIDFLKFYSYEKFEFLFHNTKDIKPIQIVTFINCLFDQNKIKEVELILKSDYYHNLSNKHYSYIDKEYKEKIKLITNLKSF